MITVIGIDFSATKRRTGLAHVSLTDGAYVIEKTALPASSEAVTEVLLTWLESVDTAILALDAPLGWPQPMATALQEHRAGVRLSVKPDAMFSRLTDKQIQRRLCKRPFEVGAALIARTAHASLELLGELRRRMNQPIPLAWNPKLVSAVQAIEVYPAATHIAHKLDEGPNDLDRLQDALGMRDEPWAKSDHVRDAVACAVAGWDFLNGQTEAPTSDQRDKAEREGWIWAKVTDRKLPCHQRARRNPALPTQ